MRVFTARLSLARVMLVLAALSAVAAPRAGDGPRLRVEEPNVDLGLVVRGEYREAEFVLHNESTAPLEIRDVNTGCGCTLVTVDRVIPAGGSGVLRATVDSTKFSGELNRPIQFSTNERAGRPVLLNLRAVILGSVDYDPQELRLSNVERSGPREGLFVVRKNFTEKGELEISGAGVAAPWVAVRAERLTEHRSFEGPIPHGRPGDWVLHVRLEPTAAYGATRHELTFKTGLPREPEVVLPVWTVVRPPVNLSVERLALAPGGAGSLHATVRRGLSPADLRIETRPDDLAVSVEQGGGARHLRIDARWTPRGDAREGTIVFRIGEERVELPVTLDDGS